MEVSFLTSFLLPASLFIIMLGMGLSLVVNDFKRVTLYPKATIIGLVNQLILLPLVAFIIVSLIGLPPLISIGFMLIAACPGGVTSNLITHVSKGDIALSITLTAISSFITVITIPLILTFSFYHFLGSSQTIELPLIKTITQILAITVIPVSIGMAIKYRYPKFALKMEKPAKTASTIIFILIMIIVIVANIELVKKHFLELGWISLLLNVVMMGLGFLIASLFGLKLPQKITISIETGIQNGTLALVIASSILKLPEISIPAVVYSLVMFFTGGYMMYKFGRRKT